MLKILLVNFPFLDDPKKTKTRPVLCLTKPVGKYKIVIVAFITTQVDEILETDEILDIQQKEFHKTGLKYTSLIKLHKLASVPLDSVRGEVGMVSDNSDYEIKRKLIALFKLQE